MTIATFTWDLCYGVILGIGLCFGKLIFDLCLSFIDALLSPKFKEIMKKLIFEKDKSDSEKE